MISDEKSAREYVARFADEVAMATLERLAERLRIENDRQNLVSKNSLNNMWARHFADSAQLLEHVPRETSGPWLDLGSGAGFPGLILAILKVDTEFILIESRRLRVEWLESIRNLIGLENCRIEGVRLEGVEDCEAGVISARAFAPLPKLISLSARFSTAQTYWVLPKGRSAAQEVQDLPKRERQMFHVEHSVTDTQAGIVVGRGRVRDKA